MRSEEVKEISSDCKAGSKISGACWKVQTTVHKEQNLPWWDCLWVVGGASDRLIDDVCMLSLVLELQSSKAHGFRENFKELQPHV